MILVTTGGRSYSLRPEDYAILAALHPSMIYVGDALGADAYVAAWGDENKILVEVRKADWDQYGKAAGPIRNKRMLEAANGCAGNEYLHPILLAFPGGHGTQDCIRQAKSMGIPVIYSRPMEGRA